MGIPNLTIRAKLAITFGGLAAMVVLVAVVSLHALSVLNQQFVHYVDGVNARATAAFRFRAAAEERAIAVRDMALARDPSGVEREHQAFGQAHAEAQKHLARLKELSARSTDISPQGRGMIADLDAVEVRYGPVAQKIANLIVDGHAEEAVVATNAECKPLLAALGKAFQAYADYTERRAAQMVEEARQLYARQLILLACAAAAAVLMATAGGWLITRGLLRALGAEPSDLNQAARQVAAGNLSPVNGGATAREGSVLASLSMMQANLATIVGQVREVSESIATGSSQIASGNLDLSRRTELQASALQQTAATMDELGTTVRHNADSAMQANQLARNAADVAGQGGQVVGQVVETMRGINASSSRIVDIISVIDGIAFQTNILALNAAVEAARAGDSGRGFAVVASEVRSLAQRSAQAAKEIKALISDSVSQVETGTALVDRAGDTMTGIVQAIQRVSDIVGEISSASVEQSAGVTQVGQAVAQMDQATQQNAALVEESSAAADSLKRQAAHLVQAVAVFKLQPQFAS
jgi:methyl-accepting chemotaxis protein-1 (serine sensor receptor)